MLTVAQSRLPQLIRPHLVTSLPSISDGSIFADQKETKKPFGSYRLQYMWTWRPCYAQVHSIGVVRNSSRWIVHPTARIPYRQWTIESHSLLRWDPSRRMHNLTARIVHNTYTVHLCTTRSWISLHTHLNYLFIFLLGKVKSGLEMLTFPMEVGAIWRELMYSYHLS